MSLYRANHILVFISWFSFECIQKPSQDREGEHELTKANFIEADETQSDVDSVNIDPKIPDVSLVKVCEGRDFSV